MTDSKTERLTRVEADALRKKAANLRLSIVEAVLKSSRSPDTEMIREFRNNHSKQRQDVETAQRRARQLGHALSELKPLEDDLRERQQALSKAQASLHEFYRPLGHSAFQEVLQGNIKDQPVFADRFALQQRMDDLQNEHDSLTPATEAGTLEKTKAKAQQLAVAGKLKLEETKIGKLESQIGQQLIEQNHEESVRCDRTDQVLSQIGERRSEIARLAEQEAESCESLTTKAGELAQALNIPQIEGTHALNEELKACKAALVEAERVQGELERELPTKLLADPSIPPDSEVGSRLAELREVEQRLEHAPTSSIGSLIEGVLQRNTATKALIGGGIAMGVLAVVCCGGLALFGPGDKDSGMSASEKIVFARKCIGVAELNPDLAVNMLLDKVTGAWPEWSDDEVGDVMLALSEQEKPLFGELVTKCQEEHEAHMRQADANWRRFADDIEREKERQHELEKVRSSQAAETAPMRSDASRQDSRHGDANRSTASSLNRRPSSQPAESGWSDPSAPSAWNDPVAAEAFIRESQSFRSGGGERRHEPERIGAAQSSSASQMTVEEERRVVREFLFSPLSKRPEVRTASDRLVNEALTITDRIRRGEISQGEGRRLAEEADARHRKELIRIKNEVEQ